MTDEPMATGIVEAVVVDALLELGTDVHEILGFSHEPANLPTPRRGFRGSLRELARRLQAFGLPVGDPLAN
jgi:hypothetical protein